MAPSGGHCCCRCPQASHRLQLWQRGGLCSMRPAWPKGLWSWSWTARALSSPTATWLQVPLTTSPGVASGGSSGMTAMTP
eukprot:8800983-Lingulodinium_polyedra.AAC.1